MRTRRRIGDARQDTSGIRMDTWKDTCVICYDTHVSAVSRVLGLLLLTLQPTFMIFVVQWIVAFFFELF